MRTYTFWQALAAECVGTFLLVFAGTSVAVAATLKLPIAGTPADSLAVSLAFGLSLVALAYGLSGISGAHFNPAVTIGLAVTGAFPWKKVAPYVAVQFASAVLASWIVWEIFGDRARSQALLGATQPANGYPLFSVFLVEVAVTFLLVLVICLVTADWSDTPPAAAGLAIGLALAMGVLIAGPISGGAVNPARALGPMLVAWTLKGWWAYLAAPVVGGLLAAVLCRFFRPTSDEPARHAA